MGVPHVFLDTNIFLHYQPFDQISWVEVLGASNIVLVVAPVVVRELDEHKDHHRLSAIRDRARAALKKIDQIDSGERLDLLPDAVELEYAKEPTIDFQQRGLRLEVNDDHLIASCLAYRDSEPDVDIVLVSGDTGPRLKARQHGIKTVSLAEAYRLPDALDMVEKEKRQLQRQIQVLENRFPKLELAFANGANQITVTIPTPLRSVRGDSTAADRQH